MTVADAVAALVEHDGELLDPPASSSTRYDRAGFSSHLAEMVQQADAVNAGKLPQERFAAWCGISVAVARSVLGRHPLIARTQATRAALELRTGRTGTPALGVIKAYAGRYNTTVTIRGVHAFDFNRRRQVHLEFVVLTDNGRVIPVSTERFAVEDVTTKEALQFATERNARDRAAGMTAAAQRDQYSDHIAAYYLQTWGLHRTGRAPHTLAEHVDALVGDAIKAAELIGAPTLYTGLPIVGGQLIAATNHGPLPSDPSVSLIGHDSAAVDRLLEFELLPVLDLNYVNRELPGTVAQLAFPVKLPGPSGSLTPHTGEQLLGAASDPGRATVVTRAELRLSGEAGLRLSVSYVDGEIELPPSRSVPVRVYYVAGLRVPHSLYLVPIAPADERAHSRALAAMLADYKDLHTSPGGAMSLVRTTCVRKGAFHVGGKQASPSESLAAIGRLAADRELHRRYWAERS